MDVKYFSCHIACLFISLITGNPVPDQIRRDENGTDCQQDVVNLLRPQCNTLLEHALSKGLETTAGVEHYCENIDFYPHCLRRHTNDYKYLHRCGVYGNLYSMPDTDKWFEMITELQNGFRDIVCGRQAKEFLEAIDCYKKNASYAFHECTSDMPEPYVSALYENPGGSSDVQFESYTYCAFLFNSAECIKRDVNAVCGDKTSDLLDDAYRIIVAGVYSEAFDCLHFLNNS